MPPPRSRAVLRGFVGSLTNPKPLLFLGAFLPQFLSPARPLEPQLWIISGSFLSVMAALDCVWVLFAARLRGWTLSRAGLLNRVCGVLLIGAGCSLLMARIHWK